MLKKFNQFVKENIELSNSSARIYIDSDEAEQGHKYTCEMISDDPIVIEFLRNQKLGDLLK